jgi:hypothetical protein
MCNSYEIQYTLCGHTTTSKSQADQYWELCRNAITINKRCDFAVFAEAYKDMGGRCPQCVRKWVEEVDEREEKAREQWKERLRVTAARGKGGETEKLR